jgi:hypothetical protein
MRGSRKSQKGMVFTIVAIIFVLVLVSAYFVYNQYRERERSFSVESRIFSINSFIHDTERDMERALYIASFRALLGMTEFMAQNGSYVTGLPADFRELVLNGTIGGELMSSTNDSYLYLWVNKVREEANYIGIDFNISNESVSLEQISPWSISIEMNYTLGVSDLAGLASWSKRDTVTATIPVEGLEDPLYTVGSHGVLSNVIIETPYSYFVNRTTGNASNLLEHTKNSYYISSTSAPSYVMRLQGQLSSSPYGIESLVYSQSLVVLGLYQNKSVVDYIYWSGSNPTNYRISGMPSWFRLDNQSSHLANYDAEGLELP